MRRAAKRHGLHTEASHRFERGADPGILQKAIDCCAQLLAAEPGAIEGYEWQGVVRDGTASFVYGSPESVEDLDHESLLTSRTCRS